MAHLKTNYAVNELILLRANKQALLIIFDLHKLLALSAVDGDQTVTNAPKQEKA